jgi:hypothetical protein
VLLFVLFGLKYNRCDSAICHLFLRWDALLRIPKVQLFEYYLEVLLFQLLLELVMFCICSLVRFLLMLGVLLKVFNFFVLYRLLCIQFLLSLFVVEKWFYMCVLFGSFGSGTFYTYLRVNGSYCSE